MSFPCYPEYKDSRVEWLGEVPAHWEVTRYKEVFSEREERSATGEETLLSVSAYTGISPRSELIDDADYLSRAESLEGYKVCYPDDLVMNIMLAWNRGLGFSKYHGIVSPAYCVFDRNRNDSPKFLDYLVRADRTTLYFKAFSAGVIDSRLRLYPDTFRALKCALPPAEEQTEIAAFLDHETAKIDALVAEQEKLIALLKEKRQAVISHAVTKGFNPDAPMKDSGIEWLGEVPAHWKVGKCGFYLTILSGYAFPSSGFVDDEDAVRLLRGINVGVSRIKWDETVYWRREASDGLDEYQLKPGDLVIGMDRPLIGEGMRVARIHERDVPCLLLQRVAALKPNAALVPEYLHLLLASELFVSHFHPETTGVSVPHISPEQINNFVIPIPPIAEQEAIVEMIQKQMSLFLMLSAESEGAIGFLKERRSALISAAVTGKIDVRGFATAKEAA